MTKNSSFILMRFVLPYSEDEDMVASDGNTNTFDYNKILLHSKQV